MAVGNTRSLQYPSLHLEIQVPKLINYCIKPLVIQVELAIWRNILSDIRGELWKLADQLKRTPWGILHFEIMFFQFTVAFIDMSYRSRNFISFKHANPSFISYFLPFWLITYHRIYKQSHFILCLSWSIFVTNKFYFAEDKLSLIFICLNETLLFS